MQVLPDRALLPFIKHYLFLESKGSNICTLRLFSDGNTGIVFSLKKNLVADLQTLPDSFLYGQVTQFKNISLIDDTSLIIVVFQPSGISQLLGILANEVRDVTLPSEYILGHECETLREQLFEKKTIQNKTDLLNKFFNTLAVRQSYSCSPLIQTALDFIQKNHGQTSVQQLVKFTGYTERHIERKFNESIGLKPKMFSNIVKLHHFLRHLRDCSDRNLTALAYESGYADQSHLIKELRRYTGMTPTSYLHKANKLAVNFIKVSPAL